MQAQVFLPKRKRKRSIRKRRSKRKQRNPKSPKRRRRGSVAVLQAMTVTREANEKFGLKKRLRNPANPAVQNQKTVKTVRSGQRFVKRLVLRIKISDMHCYRAKVRQWQHILLKENVYREEVKLV